MWLNWISLGDTPLPNIYIKSQANGAETDIEKPQQTNKLVKRMSKMKRTQKDTITEEKKEENFIDFEAIWE